MLNERVHEFLASLAGAEDIERLPMSPAQRAGRKADFFLFNRLVIAELKSFEGDRRGPMSRALDKYRNAGALRVPPGEPFLEALLRNNPLRPEILDCLVRAGGHPIEKAFKDANPQVKSTRRLWLAPEGAGMLILVNDAVDLIDPPLVVCVVEHMLNKRKPDGRLVFPAIDSVVYLTKAHQIVGLKEERLDPFLVMKRAGRDRDEELLKCEEALGAAWSAFLGLPYSHGGMLEASTTQWQYKPGNKPRPVL